MKKFYNKIAKQQWRTTVPNNTLTLFRKSPSKNRTGTGEEEEGTKMKRSSGSYDVQEAEKQFDKSRSLPPSVYLNSSSSSTDSIVSVDNHFEQALVSTEGNLNIEEIDLNGTFYVDVDEISVAEKNSKPSSQNEYDVPRISFKFFDKVVGNYENVENNNSEIEESNYEVVNVKSDNHKSEVKIILTTPDHRDVMDGNENSFKLAPCDKISLSKSLSPDEFSSAVVIEINAPYDPNDEQQILRKCGSDSNLPVSTQTLNQEEEEDDDDDDEGFYKIPRSLKRGRLSQSFNDLSSEDLHQSYQHSDEIEHISCSQIIVHRNSINMNDSSREESVYHSEVSNKPRSKLRDKLPKFTLLKKSNKTVDSLNNFRIKFNNLMIEHAAQQRVGAFDETEKLTINLEQVYKNSKTKCERVLKNTGKLFKNQLRRNSNPSNSINKRFKFESKEITVDDIEYKFDTSVSSVGKCDSENQLNNSLISNPVSCKSNEDVEDVSTVSGLQVGLPVGQNGFDDLRRYVKLGSDFCKELAVILQERAEAETTYAKSLSKLSSKLTRACREGVGGLNEAWKTVAVEMESRAEEHRLLGTSLLEETAKPLKILTDNQQKSRKHVENGVDKATKSLSEWRAGEAKSKKHSHSCSRENEKLQDSALLDNSKYGKLTLSRSTSFIHLPHQKTTPDKENAKMELKKRKAEDAVKKADIEYYTICVRAERSRLEWESAVLRGVNTFQFLEEERLNSLKNVLFSYLNHSIAHGPRLIEATEKLRAPISLCEPTKDLDTFLHLRHSSQQVSEQLLPDFYCEHITLAMNRERRKQALVKLVNLIRQDIERERKSKNGLENLSKAIKQTPNFGAEDSQQNVTEKIYHMKSILTYLEAARYKVQNALAELDSRPRSGHPLAPHITITRDKAGYQQSILKVPQWLRDEWFESDKSPVSEKSNNSEKFKEIVVSEDPEPDWNDRGAADGNSNQPDSDFDEFSSQCSSSGSGGNRCSVEENPVKPIAHCKALYAYTPNLTDELALRPGEILSVYRKQDDGWWLGECNGNVGIFPATYVEIMS